MSQQLGYHRLHRAGPTSWWRPLLGMLTAALVGFGVVPAMGVVLVGVVLFGAVLAGLVDDFGGTYEQLTGGSVTPLFLGYLVLTLAALTLVVWAVNALFHRLRPGWSTSVAGRMRWKYFFACLGLSVVVLGATLVVGSLVPQDVAAMDTTTGLNEFTRTTLAYAFIVVLFVPLQAAGEEYFFRGYLTQAMGGFFRDERVALVVAVFVPALLFALAHGAQDPPIFVDRLAFGLTVGVLVIATGGLEAAIAMHVLNNVIAFGIGIAFTDLDATLNPTSGTWWTLPSTLTQSLLFLALAWALARRMGLERTVGVNRVRGGVLAA